MLRENYQQKVDKALNGLEALNKFNSNINKKCCNTFYKIILMDLNMPVMDGYESTLQILASFKKAYPKGTYESGERLSVVAVTAFVNDENIKKCFRVGMSEVIHKPLTNESLSSILD